MTKDPASSPGGVVYILWHIRDGDEENAKLLGVFSSREKAADCQRRALLRSGFADFPDDFTVDEYELNVDQWLDGFVIES
jgi:hypothetical protein